MLAEIKDIFSSDYYSLRGFIAGLDFDNCFNLRNQWLGIAYKVRTFQIIEIRVRLFRLWLFYHVNRQLVRDLRTLVLCTAIIKFMFHLVTHVNYGCPYTA